MAELLLYLIKVSVCIILLYGLYALALKRETHFGFNRFYLLFSIVISLAIPLIKITFYGPQILPEFRGIIQAVQVSPDNGLIADNSLTWVNFLSIIYLGGVLFFVLRFISKLASLLIIRRGCRVESAHGYKLAVSTKNIAAFSFFGTVYIDQKTLDEEQLDKILLHETAHIHQRHSIDVVLAEFVCILTWFNPVGWLVQTALKETHEYLADAAVSGQSNASADYFLLLSKNIFGVQPMLANNFNKSLTLKRINMMKKTRSGRLSMLRALPVLPLLVLLFLIFSCSKDSNGLKAQNATNPAKEEKTKVQVDKMPEFPGGQAALVKFITENVKYPETARKAGIVGTVYVSFTVNKAGKPTKIAVQKKVNNLLDAEAIRVVSIMPNWTPGEKDGVPVDVEIMLPFNFKLAEK